MAASRTVRELCCQRWCPTKHVIFWNSFCGSRVEGLLRDEVGEQDGFEKLNFVGLKRANIPHQHVVELKAILERFYHMNGRFQDRARVLLPEAVSDEARHFLEFFLRESRLGFVSLRGGRTERI